MTQQAGTPIHSPHEITGNELNDLTVLINSVNEFMEQFSSKTPIEKENFDFRMKKVEYAILLYEANGGKQNEQINEAALLVAKYRDKFCVEQNQIRRNFVQSLRNLTGQALAPKRNDPARGTTRPQHPLSRVPGE